ncbi:hypothetical protein E2C01_016947 [Portunus trituberculatus]|uniref:Uncharacterized protein n=1 Tax=Portunus trituberculatus TaxID=210409 RepID=A0A5B7DQJ6_PORTR|nr:hypothetical protein [Portunus trituberculatus]
MKQTGHCLERGGGGARPSKVSLATASADGRRRVAVGSCQLPFSSSALRECSSGKAAGCVVVQEGRDREGVLAAASCKIKSPDSHFQEGIPTLATRAWRRTHQPCLAAPRHGRHTHLSVV